ncbi:hypothetical protein ACFSKW_25165 [Nonomuraea mangrovi]|uniref:Uncharacterized protein n=1 Tax=Nonomuraea mangrovi TaxID=2316207 RepID=A0ABW4T2P8_9ACTN
MPNGGSIDRAQLVDRITGALKIPETAAQAALTELTDGLQVALRR